MCCVSNGLEIDIADVRIAAGLQLEEDWYAVKALDADTLAIGEPAYHQRNWTFLLNGENNGSRESLLFDTGSGRRSIRPLISRYAARNVSVLPSHMHFDHLGGVLEFDRVLVADLPVLRATMSNGFLTPGPDLHIGCLEDVPPPTFHVSEWVLPGSVLAVGSRRLDVLHVPGHSPDSIALWEPDRCRVYVGDFVYRGALYAHTPGASLQDYLLTAEALLDLLPPSVEIVCAHGRPVGGVHDVPILGREDLCDLHRVLRHMLKSPNQQTGEVRINGRMSLLVGEQSFKTFL